MSLFRREMGIGLTTLSLLVPFLLAGCRGEVSKTPASSEVASCQELGRGDMRNGRNEPQAKVLDKAALMGKQQWASDQPELQRRAARDDQVVVLVEMGY
ncbi:MAG: hypothetical protein ACPG4T_07865, partial [Nannocystaceae bacterium]